MKRATEADHKRSLGMLGIVGPTDDEFEEVSRNMLDRFAAGDGESMLLEAVMAIHEMSVSKEATFAAQGRMLKACLEPMISALSAERDRGTPPGLVLMTIPLLAATVFASVIQLVRFPDEDTVRKVHLFAYRGLTEAAMRHLTDRLNGSRVEGVPLMTVVEDGEQAPVGVRWIEPKEVTVGDVVRVVDRLLMEVSRGPDRVITAAEADEIRDRFDKALDALPVLRDFNPEKVGA